MEIKRGDIFLAKLTPRKDSCIIYGIRPVVVISNDISNQRSPIVTIIPITSKPKKNIPAHVQLTGHGLKKKSIGLIEQMITIDKKMLIRKIGNLNGTLIMDKINLSLKHQLGVA